MSDEPRGADGDFPIRDRDLHPEADPDYDPDSDPAFEPEEPSDEPNPDKPDRDVGADIADGHPDVEAAEPTDGSAADSDVEFDRRVRVWVSSASGRFRQTAAELRQNLAGEAAAKAALEALAARAETRPEGADLTAAAFFDVDNTLVQGASIVHFARGLAAHKYFSYADIASAAWMQVKFQITGKENADDVAEGRDKALSFIAGRSTAELAALGDAIYDDYIADKIWAGTRALTQRHLDAGQQVWLVTATPVELAQTIANRLGLTGALGTVAESKDGVFTGRLVGDVLHGLGKAHAVRSLAIREGLNLQRCTAYSDSHNDVPMLSLVGTAVAINPDSDLKQIAKVRGWESYDFRTARKAAKYGVPTAIALGAIGGGAAAALRRGHRG